MSARAGVEGVGLLEVEHQREKALNPLQSEDSVVEGKVTWRNLPQKKQLLLLALCRLSTPLSNACLLPYLYYLVKSILSDPEHPSAPQQISRLTGLLVAAYPLGQMSTSMIWGRLSDHYGRKPAILLGLFVSVTANLAFGFSRTIGMLLFWRVLAGMANGMLGVMRTMTAEIVKDRKYHTRAFLALPVVFNSGRVAALAIGGCLADPVKNIPWLFGPRGLFNFYHHPEGVAWALVYPYALPALFNGAVLATCLILAFLWLKESLPSRENSWDPGLVVGRVISNLFTKKTRRLRSGYSAIQIEENQSLSANLLTTESGSGSSTPIRAKPASRRSGLRGIWTRPLVKTLIAFGLLPLHNATFLHVFPVFLSMPTAPNSNATIVRFTGGLGLASPTVGLYLASFGICGILLQLFIYPRIQKYVGNLGVFRIASAIFPAAYLLAPYLTLLSGHNTAQWVAMATVLFLQVMGRTMAMPSSVILLTEAAPRRDVLGTVHGAGSTLSALSSAVGPVIGGMLLAKGIDIGVIGLVWWSWLLLVALVALGWSCGLEIEEKGEEAKLETQLE
ncbi:MFS general substrate transporter [Paraphaeosphaeria sporulosa]|uniref:MFS general substrate transporter n=1 Tax=Paraphaeosphaeria sporulosa TaxID=1460663 RepID=A0A177CW81_9PLEO|nr:MFS general substrate transporter [Paraphaeosphaeria sporulosa]OAG11773.1 MFS general substrate transporter [Paraphaeosphaeria sporulosa]